METGKAGFVCPRKDSTTGIAQGYSHTNANISSAQYNNLVYLASLLDHCLSIVSYRTFQNRYSEALQVLLRDILTQKSIVIMYDAIWIRVISEVLHYFVLKYRISG